MRVHHLARRAAFVAGGALLVFSFAARAHGQRVPAAPAALGAGRADSAAPAGPRKRPPPWLPPIASLAIPGAGQLLLGESRAIAYFAVETFAILEYRAQITEARAARGRYEALADDVARRFFGNVGERRSFEYYEAMRGYVESGAFDRVPGGDIDPEIDERTFNGSIWKLARDTYWNDPDRPPPAESAAYANAVSMYLQRAVPTGFRWSWRNAALEHDLYRRSIKESNDAFRRARQQLGLMLANHMLSMADAIATVRVRQGMEGGRPSTRIELSLPWPRANVSRRAR